MRRKHKHTYTKQYTRKQNRNSYVKTHKKRRGINVIAIMLTVCVMVGAYYIINEKQKHLSILSESVQQLSQEVEQKEKEYEVTLQQLEIAQKQLSLEATSRKELMTQLEKQRQAQTNINNMFDKICYLTFDDGPSVNTEKILDILKANHIKATFFVVYTRYGDEKNIYKRIVDEGHAIGNHGYAHKYPKSGQYYEDFHKLQNFLLTEIGFKPDILRLPGGSESGWSSTGVSATQAQQLTNEGNVYFDWTSLAMDSRRTKYTPQGLVDNVVQSSNDRSIEVVLMHDRADNKNTPEALQGIIDYFRFNGYVFMPLNSGVKPPQFYVANK